jgi:hypothetical protein
VEEEERDCTATFKVWPHSSILLILKLPLAALQFDDHSLVDATQMAAEYYK